MAYDENLKFTGASASVQTETVSTTANGTGVYIGAERVFLAELRIAGTVTGTSPTLDIKFQDATADVTYTDMGYSFVQQTASMDSATDVDTQQRVSVTTRPGKPYVRIVKTVGGTTPVFNGVSVLAKPLPDPVQ